VADHGTGAASKSVSGGDQAMKMNGTSILIGVTVLALGVGLLAISTSEAQRATGVSRVGWLEVCGQAQRPYFDIFRRRLGELGYVEGKKPFYRAAICRVPLRPDAEFGD
jgi:hypothetical protein